MHLARPLALCHFLLALSGCQEAPPVSYDVLSSVGPLALYEASLRGDFGTFRDFVASMSEGEAGGDERRIRVTVSADRPDRGEYGMWMLSLEGAEPIEPGSYVLAGDRASASRREVPGSVFGSLVLCGGSSPFDRTAFDVAVEDAVVEIADGPEPDTLLIRWTGTTDRGRAAGEAVLDAPSAPFAPPTR